MKKELQEKIEKVESLEKFSQEYYDFLDNLNTGWFDGCASNLTYNFGSVQNVVKVAYIMGLDIEYLTVDRLEKYVLSKFDLNELIEKLDSGYKLVIGRNYTEWSLIQPVVKEQTSVIEIVIDEDEMEEDLNEDDFEEDDNSPENQKACDDLMASIFGRK